MKAKFTSSVLINIVIAICITLFISFIVFMIQGRPAKITITNVRANETSSRQINALPPIDPIIPDTIPHRRYVQLADSIKFARTIKDGISTGFSMQGIIGFQKISRCENCNFHDFDQSYDKNRDYLISFGDWKLDTRQDEIHRTVIYYVKNHRSYLRKTFCKIKSRSKWGSNFDCIEKDIAVPFRIDNYNKNIMVPVSATTFKIARGIGISLTVLFFIYFVYFIIGGFIKFLAEIAQGTPFSERNVNRLKFITLNLLFIPLGAFLINALVIPLVFHNYFTPDIVLDNESWKSLFKPAILCLIFAALYRAFRKGKQLKEENDLTV